MKKHINLFKKTTESREASAILKKFNTIGFVISIFLFLVCVTIFLLNIQLQKKQNALIMEKSQMETTLERQTHLQLKIDALAQKTSELKQYAKEDAQSAKYYNLLKKIFADQKLPQFSTLKVSKNGIVEFGIDANSYEELQAVLSYLESEEFLGYFLELKLDRLSISDSNKKSSFTLNFIGHFKQLNETT